jgi:cell wall-associated NlpC family hydrolase
MTITGDNALNLTFSSTNATALTNVDASAQTGGLTFSLANLKDTGTDKLGTGTDVITVTTASTGATGFESIQNFEKTAAVAVSTANADATAAAAAIAAADKVALGTSQVADADYNGSTSGNGTLSGGAILNGVLTFTGAGPATLADAVAIADAGADTAGEAVLFEYIGNSYVFVQGSTDILVQLTGITGVTNFVEDGTSNSFFIV